jgi:SAM-dependent methyltransferase
VLGQSLTPAPAEIPLTERRLPPGERITTIIRLFLLDPSVSRPDAATALAPLGVEDAEALGLVTSRDDEVRPLLRITPSGELYFASDRRLGSREGVMGLAPSSALLGNLTVRRPVARALDVGTGSGILTVLAARHAERVVATDLSERALAFAAFNAALSGFFKLSDDTTWPSAGDAVRRMVAELYCERMELHIPPGSGGIT